MKALRRWTSSIAASFDYVVTQIENHDALITRAMKEMQSAVARAKVQLKRVSADGQGLRKRIAELEAEEQSWRDRAEKFANDNKVKALECLRREKRVKIQLKELEEQAIRHRALENQLKTDLSKAEDRLTRLVQQRNLLRTRESRAQALKIVTDEDSTLVSEIDEIFDRWETKVTEYEFEGGCCALNRDEFEEELLSEEEKIELTKELESLCLGQSVPR